MDAEGGAASSAGRDPDEDSKILLAVALGIGSRYFVVRRQSNMTSPDNVPKGECNLRREGISGLGLRVSRRLAVTALIAAGLFALAVHLANAAKAGVAPAVLPPLAKEQGTANSSPARPTEVGQLMVSANVKGAMITVDGRSDPRWLTPYTIPDLSAGPHDVVISMDGYANYEQTVTIVAGKTSNLVVVLSPPRGEFDMETDPPGVEILIDGESYGPSPVRATLDPGNHTFEVKQQGVAPYENTFSIKSGEVLTKKLILGAPSGTGTVEVRTIPPGATVQADGAVVGGLTPTSFRLSVGSHTLDISLSGYQSAQRQVAVSASEPTPVNVILSAEAPPAPPVATTPASPPPSLAGARNAEIRIETTPAGIEILIDGKSYGPSPVTATLPPGNHTYTVKPPGMAPYQNSFTVKSGEIIVKKLTLQSPAAAHPAASAPPPHL